MIAAAAAARLLTRSRDAARGNEFEGSPSRAATPMDAQLPRTMPRTLLPLVAAVLAALLVPAVASARGGSYVFEGGTPRQQAKVRVALEASSFDWDIVDHTVVIHLRKGAETSAKRGEIWIDTDLLSSGVFAWGPIQHEYAHQVDFFLLADADRVRLNRVLGGRTWFPDGGVAAFRRGADHAEFGAERFASTLAWAYWQVPENSLKPTSAKDESAAMEPSRFRQLLERILGARNPAPPVLAVAAGK